MEDVHCRDETLPADVSEIGIVDLVDQLEETVQCGICLETYKDPRTLKCRHTFCLYCLHNLYRSKASQNLICPNCKQEMDLGDGGVEAIEKNSLLAQLSQLSNKFRKVLEAGDPLHQQRVQVSFKDNENDERTISNATHLGVPFKVNQMQAIARFRQWLPTLRDSPLNLPETVTDIKITPKFCPCYEFSMTANTRYSVKVCLINNIIHPCTGDHGGQYSVVVYASEELRESFRKVLQSSKIDILQDTDLTSIIEKEDIGILTKTIEKEAAKSDAELQVQLLEKDACANFIMQRHQHPPAHAVTELMASTTIVRSFVSERLLPVHTGTYKYNNRTFHFIVSGITGEVFGEYPQSQVMKTVSSLRGVGNFVLTMLALVVLLWFLSIKQQEAPYVRRQWS